MGTTPPIPVQVFVVEVAERVMCPNCGNELILQLGAGFFRRWYGKLRWAWSSTKTQAEWHEYLAHKRWYSCNTDRCPYNGERVPLRKIEIPYDPVAVGLATAPQP